MREQAFQADQDDIQQSARKVSRARCSNAQRQDLYHLTPFPSARLSTFVLHCKLTMGTKDDLKDSPD